MLSILLINKKQVFLHRIYTVSYLELLFYRIDNSFIYFIYN